MRKRMDLDKEILLEYQKNLKKFRKFAGWTQAELGEMLGMSKQNISNLENGRINMTPLHYYALRYLFEPIVREEIARCIVLGDGNIYGYKPVWKEEKNGNT
jgi:transcriptional regulator with XRE-family HTH domain